jgi:hypothetical protein
LDVSVGLARKAGVAKRFHSAVYASGFYDDGQT